MGEVDEGQFAVVAHMAVFQDSRVVEDIEAEVVVVPNHLVAFALGSTHSIGLVRTHLIAVLGQVVQTSRRVYLKPKVP